MRKVGETNRAERKKMMQNQRKNEKMLRDLKDMNREQRIWQMAMPAPLVKSVLRWPHQGQEQLTWLLGWLLQ